MQNDMQFASSQFFDGVSAERFKRATVPNHHRAAAVLALRYGALEIYVGDWMILDLHRQTFLAFLVGNSFWNGPRFQGAVQLQAKIIVQMRGSMFLDDEPGLARVMRRLGLWLGGFGEIPF